MEETYKTKAIILNRQSFKENDTKISVFCLEHGRLELVARGTKKISSKMAGHLEPISLSNIMVVRGKQYDYAGSAINENVFLNIKNDYDKISAAGQAISIFRKLVKEGEKDEGLFNLLNDFFEKLNKRQPPTTDCQLFFSFFLLKLLVELGHKPELCNCVSCGKKITPSGNSFSFSRGGLVCRVCSSREALTISDDCIKVLRMAALKEHDFLKLAKVKLSKKLNDDIIKIIGLFYQYNFS